MSDESVSAPTNAAEVATETPQVSQPSTSSKPYDDDMLEVYEKEAINEDSDKQGSDKDIETTTQPDAEGDKKATEEEAEETPLGEKKGDKVEDNFESVVVKKLVNGKEVGIKIGDAITAFVKQEEFNRNMDSRLRAVDVKEKRWQSDQEQFKGKIGKLIDVAQKGDFVSAVRGIAKLAAGSSGLDVVKFEEQYFSQLDKVREVLTKMSPEQQKAYWAERRAAEAEQEARKLREEKTVNTEKSQLSTHVATLQQQFNIPEAEFWGNYQTLAKEEVGEGKTFQNPNDISAEEVVKYTLAVRHEEKVLQAAGAFGIEDDGILDEISKVTKLRPQMTVEEMKALIEQSGIAKNADARTVENLNRKVGSSKSTQFSKASLTKKDEKIEGYDEESLDFLYRNQPRPVRRPAR